MRTTETRKILFFLSFICVHQWLISFWAKLLRASVVRFCFSDSGDLINKILGPRQGKGPKLTSGRVDPLTLIQKKEVLWLVIAKYLTIA